MAVETLRQRLILGAGLWLILALAVGGSVLGHAFRDSAEQGLHLRLDAHLRSLLAVMEVGEDGGVTIGRPLGEPRFEQAYSGWYWQVSDGIAVKARSRSLWDFALPAAGEGEDSLRIEAGPRGESLTVMERDLAFGEDGKRLHVAVAASRAEVEGEVRRFDLLLALSLGGLGLGLLAAVAVQVGYGLRPLRRLEAELDGLLHGAPRLEGTYPREVAPLVAAMNRVLDHDSRLIEHARNHLGNLAHALKTPLAVLSAEGADQGVRTAQIGRLTRLIDLHLTRARAGASSARLTGSRADIAMLAADIAGTLRKVHAERRLEIIVDCPPGSSFAADGDDLAEMLGNLMDNACKWAREKVRVRAVSGAIVIEDDGPGLSADQAASVLRRGIRLDESIPGSGLGLAIVADLAALSGIGLEFRVSEWGGLAVRLTEPGTLS
ncbi:MAG: sensor histidine kinase [Magnetospirillum sp.]|nr:sensor histidine kinase [Magnetospirillum sp.]